MTEEALFHAALPVPPAERPAWLAEHCPDSELRRRVEDLLAAHDRPAGPLDSPATGAYEPSALDTTGAPGMRIEQYKLLQLIGEGGMGAVWMAEQEQPVRRRVAVKVIKPGMDSRQVIARFEAERQALALMDHPNIARVLDAGQSPPAAPGGAGSPYFVMELVKGVPITQYCDANHLTPRERLELFVPVCQAVQHAHQKGIIHRDLKPSNVLIALYDGRPVPKVIDFGVAKATGPRLTNQTLFTEFGQIVGTLEYMAPEQAELNNLDIDTRADIYSLGVLLYELLTGGPPFSRKQLQGAALDEMLRLIREVEPPKPSTKLSSSENLPTIAANRKLEPKRLTKLVHGDLDWIAMKCLEKDRGRRYQTPNGLAAEIQRFLADEPVLAGPPSAAYRLRKFVRRHKGPVLAASLVVLALVGGVIGTTIGLVEARRERDAAEAAGRAEAEQRRLADAAAAAEKAAKEQAQRRLAQIERGVELFAGMLKGINPRVEERGGEQLYVQLRKRAEKAAAELDGDVVGDPQAMARLQTILGETLRELGSYSTAVAVLEKARATRERELGADHPLTLNTLNLLAAAYGKAGDLPKAIQLDEQVRSVRAAKLGADHPDTLVTMNNLAVSYQRAGKLPEAIRLYEQARDAQVAKLGADHPSTLATLNNLAGAYDAAGRLPEAIRLLEQVRDAALAKLGADHPSTLTALDSLAKAYNVAGRLPEAIRLLEQVRDARVAKLGVDHPDTLSTLNALAGAYQDAGKLPEAIRLLEQARDAKVAKLGADHPSTLLTMNDLAAAYRAAGRLPEAIGLLEQVRPGVVAKLGADHPDTLTVLNNLAGAYEAAGRLPEAIRLFEQVRDAEVAKLGADHPKTLVTLNNLAGAYYAAGKLPEAIRLFEQLRDAFVAKLGAYHPKSLTAMNNLAQAYKVSGKLPEAIHLMEQVRDAQVAKLGTDHPSTLLTLNNLASAYQAAGKLPEAIALFEQVRDAYVAKLGADHPSTLLTLNNLAAAYLAAGRLPEAIPLFEEAAEGVAKRKFLNEYAGRIVPNTVRAYEANRQFDKSEAWQHRWLAHVKERAGPQSFAYAEGLAALAALLLKQEKWTEAETNLRECLSIRAKLQPDSWTVFTARSMLGEALARQQKFAEAEPLLVQSYEGLKKRFVEAGTTPTGGQTAPPVRGHGPPPVPPVRLADAIGRLIRLYSDWGKPAEAARWLDELWALAGAG